MQQQCHIPHSRFRVAEIKVLRRSNMTLIEVILASVMFVIAVLGSSSIYLANRRNLRRAELRRRANWAAVGKMEELKSLPYEEIEDMDNRLDPEVITFRNHAMERVVLVGDINEEGGAYRQVTVTVRSLESGEELVSLVTYIAE